MFIHDSRQTVFYLWILHILTLFMFTSSRVNIVERNIQFAKETRLGTNDSSGVFETIARVSLRRCVKFCKRRPACSFINYRRTVQLCMIIKYGNQNQTVTINERNMHVTGTKSDWNMTPYAGCSNCSIGDICSDDGYEVSCRKTSCGPPTIPEGVIVSGNIYSPGSRLIIRCVDGSQSEQGEQERITCLSTGLWTTSNFSCIPQSTTPTEPPTTTPPFPCNSFDSHYKTATISDNSVVTYKLYTTLAVPKEQASQTCRGDGGELIKLNTTARMEFVLQLTSCQEMPGDDVWIDGTYDIHTNTWAFTDGDPVPMTTDFWRLGAPDDLSTDHCVRLSGYYGFMMDDRRCSVAFLFLCEVF